MKQSALSPAVTAPTTLAVLLGASAWPRSSGLEASGAFAQAKHEFEVYLLDPRGFGLSSANRLDLFNKEIKASDQLDALRKFLQERRAALDATHLAVSDILIYFVGHADFAGPEQIFCLLPRQAESSLLKTTGIHIDEIAQILQEEAPNSRQYFVLDCCFAGAAAVQLFQGARAADRIAVNKTVDAFHRFPTRGSALLYSSNRDLASLRLPDDSGTRFSYALLRALRNGEPEHNHPLSLRELATLVQAQVRLLQQKSGLEDTPLPDVAPSKRSDGEDDNDVADIPFFPNPSIPRQQTPQTEEDQQELNDDEVYSQASPMKIIVRGIRLLACGITFILYWLTYGYMTKSLFHKKILKLSGSTPLIIFLLGEEKRTQPWKLVIIFCSLTIDYLLVGILLSHAFHVSSFPFPLPYTATSWLVGAFLAVVCLALFGLQIHYDTTNFMYKNVINLRKMQLIAFISFFLVLASQFPFFGASFLYFPLAASIISVALFLYNLIGLGGASYSDELTGLNPKWEALLQEQREHTARSKAYFGRRKRKNMCKSIFLD